MITAYFLIGLVVGIGCARWAYSECEEGEEFFIVLALFGGFLLWPLPLLFLAVTWRNPK